MTTIYSHPVDKTQPSGPPAGPGPKPLRELAAAKDPLRRRTAITAPLWFVRRGDDADFATLLSLAAVLAADPEPMVHKAVGIALKHAGARDPRAVVAFLEQYSELMPPAALRSAVGKLDSADRARFKR